MARISRIVLPGVPHHVTQRGNRRQRTFFNDADYQAYVGLLRKACRINNTEVWAWCLMPNHVHLILVPAFEDGLRATLAEAHRRYTRRVNFREGWRGHLWQERFYSFPMDEAHLLAAVRYVELNPVNAGLVHYPQQWPWSSASARLEGHSDGLTTLTPLCGSVADWSSFWLSTLPKESDRIRRHSRTGRPLGSKAFLNDAERLSGRILRPRKPGPKPRKLTGDEHQGQQLK